MAYISRKVASVNRLPGDIPGVGYAIDRLDGKRKALKPERFMSDPQGQEFEETTPKKGMSFI